VIIFLCLCRVINILITQSKNMHILQKLRKMYLL